MSKEHFIIFEGIDGCGKGTLLELLAKYLSEKYDLKIKDIRKNPDYDINSNLIVSAEPTYYETGIKIREYLKKIEKYDKSTIDKLAKMFSNDRLMLYEKIIIPFFNKYPNAYFLQERSVISSLVYQGFKYRDLKGNQLALSFPATVFILDVLPEMAIERLNKRDKKDYAYFEKLDFLKAIRKKYLSKELKEFLTSLSFNVIYINNSSEPKQTLDQIINILKLG